MIDEKKIKGFWERRASADEKSTNLGLNSLSEEKQDLKKEIEKEKVMKYLDIKEGEKILDLGCGIGKWSFMISEKGGEVLAIDYCCKMIENAKKIADNMGICNVKFSVGSMQDFFINEKFDKVFLSGVILHLNEDSVLSLFENIKKMSKIGTAVVIRDSSGIYERYEIVDKYSEALKDKYSAIYRTREELLDILNKYGFKLENDENMFDDESGLNIYKETKLRIYRFVLS